MKEYRVGGVFGKEKEKKIFFHKWNNTTKGKQSKQVTKKKGKKVKLMLTFSNIYMKNVTIAGRNLSIVTF